MKQWCSQGRSLNP